MIETVRLGAPGAPADFGAAVDAFYSTPLPASHPCAAGLLVHGLPGGRSALLTKLHHALGDGVTVLRGMLSATDIASHAWATPLHRQVARTGLRDALRRNDIRLIARGLHLLARNGTAPARPAAGRPAGGRHYEFARIPQATLRAAAAASGLTTGELIPAGFAEAVHRVYADRPGRPDELRIMLPWSVRDTSSTHATGNRTGALSLDVPIGALPRDRRFAAVRTRLRHHARHGMPHAARAVVRAMGLLPPPLQALAARGAYNSRWFSVLGSMIPGPRTPVRVDGCPLVAGYPVLPLAPGVDLAWGTLTWGASTSLCVTAAGDWTERAAPLVREWQAVLAELAGGAP